MRTCGAIVDASSERSQGHLPDLNNSTYYIKLTLFVTVMYLFKLVDSIPAL
jgi:hypothetical protein